MKKIIQSKLFASIITIFVLGFIFGIIFLFIVKDRESDIIYKGIEEYIDLVNKNDVSLRSFFNCFMNYFMYINIIFVSSFAFIFFPLIYILNFYKGFSIGFLISSLILNYKIRGIKYALILLFPQEYIFILIMVIISLYSLINAYKLFKLYKDDKAIKIKKCVVSALEIFINYKIVNILF